MPILRKEKNSIALTLYSPNLTSIKQLFSVKMQRELNYWLRRLQIWDIHAFIFIRKCNSKIVAGKYIYLFNLELTQLFILEFIMISKTERQDVLFAQTFSLVVSISKLLM